MICPQTKKIYGMWIKKRKQNICEEWMQRPEWFQRQQQTFPIPRVRIALYRHHIHIFLLAMTFRSHVFLAWSLIIFSCLNNNNDSVYTLFINLRRVFWEFLIRKSSQFGYSFLFTSSSHLFNSYVWKTVFFHLQDQPRTKLLSAIDRIKMNNHLFF